MLQVWMLDSSKTTLKKNEQSRNENVHGWDTLKDRIENETLRGKLDVASQEDKMRDLFKMVWSCTEGALRCNSEKNWLLRGTSTGEEDIRKHDPKTVNLTDWSGLERLNA